MLYDDRLTAAAVTAGLHMLTSMSDMTYAILDNGNLVDSFDQEDLAVVALDRLATAGSEVAQRLLLVTFDDHENVVADRVPDERIGQHA